VDSNEVTVNDNEDEYEYVEMTDEELAEWRARFGRTDRPRVIRGQAHSVTTIRPASDEPEAGDG
jgi:hypothetical protein